MEKQVVYKITKNEDEAIHISTGVFKDKSYADFRIFFRTKEDGEWRPTKKGITFEVSHLAEFLKGVQELEKAVSQNA
ncbi:MAG: hypothetical protein COV74_00195 [Candidatus Omnitrophica bacterium CG11_big_fil_rev_8_21_14_0_20_45_26]|uniref:Transcriptional coactivator p15 (PC4) C-terminal domain-containing protein n=1 Tax=Candidatus Abzuiibacterium crystallinum TaxID=1974748 RepID=A0A2H0LT35_9BACT|nr:MAG: hypothetical protein COV74_00195 [Candidatus Omnitrophica bacterium CG11_big_fil_rev_8_21_14_0_20_45_26]PIW64787.1 MAG: hypothetical protein COW12_04610 [Candidatus Omnitrophica bacterium CG12_big_fil_rev_8_21_14_0_65_45_16]